MKKIKLTYALVFTAICCLAAVSGANAQDSTTLSSEERYRSDSLELLHDRAEETRIQQAEDSDNLSDLKNDKRATKEKAREAKRVEREANDAARESRMAYKSERKAQNARKQADKQSKKADRARVISDQN